MHNSHLYSQINIEMVPTGVPNSAFPGYLRTRLWEIGGGGPPTISINDSLHGLDISDQRVTLNIG